MDELNAKREIIQKLDKEILDLLMARVGVAKSIGLIKKSRGEAIYVPEVEKKKIEALSAECVYPGLVETIWPVIMCYTRSVE